MEFPMRTFSFFRTLSLAMVGGLVLFAALPAFATSILELKTDSSLTMQPGSTDAITFRMTNSGTTTTPDNFIGWVLGLQFIPQAGATGTVTVAGGSPLTGGTVNPMPFGDLQISQPAIAQIGSGATINGLTNYWFMNVNTLTDLGTVAVGQTYEMGKLSLTASGDAAGKWDVYTVQQNSPLFKTYWFDGSALEQPFGNIPWVGGGNYSLKLGEVEVVPEPGTLAFLGMAGLGAGGYALRRRRRKAVVAGEAVAA
jgi:hypothetical protein